jgi:putative isomerase
MKPLFFFIALFCAPACFANWVDTIDRYGEPHVVTPQDAYSHSPFNPMFDNGAWHGHLLPATTVQLGGFPGTAIIAEEYLLYLSHYLDRLQLYRNSQKLVLTGKTYAEPGVLFQTLSSKNVTVRLELRFVDERTSLLKTTITSQDKLELHFDGKLLTNYDEKTTLADRFPMFNPNSRWN